MVYWTISKSARPWALYAGRKEAMEKNDKLYTKELDGDICTWYFICWVGPMICVSNTRNAKRTDYKRYYHNEDIGKRIFLARSEAKAATPRVYHQTIEDLVKKHELC